MYLANQRCSLHKTNRIHVCVFKGPLHIACCRAFSDLGIKKIDMLLTVGDLFDAQATEAASQRLVAVLNAQAKHIEHLGALVQTLVVSRDAQQSLSEAQQEQLAQLQERQTALENAVAQQNERSGSMGISLASMQKAVDKKVDRSMLQHEVQKMNQQNSSLARQV